MKNSKYIAAILGLSLALPVLAGGGGGGGGGRGGRGGRGGQGGQGGIDQTGQGGNTFGIGGGGQGGQGGFGGGGGGFGGGGFGGPGGFGGGPGGGGGGPGGGRNPGNITPGGFGGRTRGTQSQLTGDYAILETTSIFSRDRRALAYDYQEPVVQRTQPVVDKGTIPVFRGIMKDEKGVFTAMIESTQGGMVNISKLHEGDTIPYNGAKVTLITDNSMTVNMPSNGDQMGESVIVSIGNNIQNEAVQASSVVGTYISADLLAGNTNNNNNFNNGGGRGGRGGRGGQGGQGGQGGFGGGGQGGFGGQGGQGGFGGGGAGGGGRGGFGGGGGGQGFGGGGIGLVGAAPGSITVNPGIVNPSLDPPLPPGNADNLEARMAARRALQVGN